jgi:sortase A
MKRRKRIIIIGMVLVLLGLILILFALGFRACTSMEQDAYIRQYLAEETQGNAQQTIVPSSSPEETMLPDTEKILNDKKDEDKKSNVKKPITLIGILEIPKLDLKVAIGEGVDKRTLRSTVGHFAFTAQPGAQGNCCIIGHRSYVFGMYFNRLDELAAGDRMTIQHKGKTYTYEVTEKEVVQPSEVRVLNPTVDAQLTLVTCTPVRVATHRLIVRAKLIP